MISWAKFASEWYHSERRTRPGGLSWHGAQKEASRMYRDYKASRETGKQTTTCHPLFETSIWLPLAERPLCIQRVGGGGGGDFQQNGQQRHLQKAYDALHESFTLAAPRRASQFMEKRHSYLTSAEERLQHEHHELAESRMRHQLLAALASREVLSKRVVILQQRLQSQDDDMIDLQHQLEEERARFSDQSLHVQELERNVADSRELRQQIEIIRAQEASLRQELLDGEARTASKTASLHRDLEDARRAKRAAESAWHATQTASELREAAMKARLIELQQHLESASEAHTSHHSEMERVRHEADELLVRLDHMNHELVSTREQHANELKQERARNEQAVVEQTHANNNLFRDVRKENRLLTQAVKQLRAQLEERVIASNSQSDMAVSVEKASNPVTVINEVACVGAYCQPDPMLAPNNAQDDNSHIDNLVDIMDCQTGTPTEGAEALRAQVRRLVASVVLAFAAEKRSAVRVEAYQAALPSHREALVRLLDAMKRTYPNLEICGTTTLQQAAVLGDTSADIFDPTEPLNRDHGWKTLEGYILPPLVVAQQQQRTVFVASIEHGRPVSFAVVDDDTFFRGDLVPLARNPPVAHDGSLLPAAMTKVDEFGNTVDAGVVACDQVHIASVKAWCGFRLSDARNVSSDLLRLAVTHKRRAALLHSTNAVLRQLARRGTLVFAGLGRAIGTGNLTTSPSVNVDPHITTSLYTKVYRAKFGMTPVAVLSKWAWPRKKNDEEDASSANGHLVPDKWMLQLAGLDKPKARVREPAVHYAFLPRTRSGNYLVDSELSSLSAYRHSIGVSIAAPKYEPGVRGAKGLAAFSATLDAHERRFFNQLGEELMLMAPIDIFVHGPPIPVELF